MKGVKYQVFVQGGVQGPGLGFMKCRGIDFTPGILQKVQAWLVFAEVLTVVEQPPFLAVQE